MINVNIPFHASEEEKKSIEYYLRRMLDIEEEIKLHSVCYTDNIDGVKVDYQIVKYYKYAPEFKNCKSISLFSLYFHSPTESSKDINPIIDMCSAQDLPTQILGADLLCDYLPQDMEERIVKHIILRTLSDKHKVSNKVALSLLIQKELIHDTLDINRIMKLATNSSKFSAVMTNFIGRVTNEKTI